MVLLSALKSFFSRSNNEIGILTINILQTSLLILFVLIALKVLTDSLGLLANLSFIERILTAGIVAVSTYLINQLFTDVISYSFSKYAEKTEADWDDVLIPLIQKIVPIIKYPTFRISPYIFMYIYIFKETYTKNLDSGTQY
ncbi:MAG: hypothetical protein MGG11_03995 [Trichodesmium sp. MAG_R03]|nr:hypothetical protein [Trichodesmium sp. MAG_R03]